MASGSLPNLCSPVFTVVQANFFRPAVHPVSLPPSYWSESSVDIGTGFSTKSSLEWAMQSLWPRGAITTTVHLRPDGLRPQEGSEVFVERPQLCGIIPRRLYGACSGDGGDDMLAPNPSPTLARRKRWKRARNGASSILPPTAAEPRSASTSHRASKQKKADKEQSCSLDYKRDSPPK